MQPGSLFGFGLVFVLVAWTLSLLLTFTIWAARRGLRRLGSAAERRAVELVAAIPVLIGIAVVTVLLLRSQVGIDHCQEHHHHAHLCLTHGESWSGRTWAVALVVVAGAIAFARLAVLGGTMLRRWRSISRLRTVSHHANGIWWVDSPQAVCFVAGFRRPEIFVSTGAWDALCDDERSAMLAHERAHVRHRDVVRRFVVDVLLFIGAPLASTLRGVWDSATERLCDARAAADTGSGESVASAMVKVCRLGVQARFSFASFTPPNGALMDRVQAVLADEPTGDRPANVLLALISTVVALTVIATAIEAEALHHVLETLLG